MHHHSSVSVAPVPSPINKPPLEKNETKKRALPAARRYGTYEPNWNDYNETGMGNKKDAASMNDTVSNASTPSPRIHPTPHHQTPPKERISRNLAPPLGGIAVTVVRKVEVEAGSDHATKRLAASKIPRPISSVTQRKDQPVQRRSQILLTRAENDQRPVLVQKIGSFDTSNRQVFRDLRGNVPQKISTFRSNFMVNAPTTNPENSNDPTDMEDENPSTNIKPIIPIIPPKLLHTALVPLEQYRKCKLAQDNLKLAPNNDPNSHPQRLSRVNLKRKKALLPSQGKRASQLFRQRLLEQSVLMSFAGSELSKSTRVKPERGAPKDIDLTPDNNRNLHPSVKQESLSGKGLSIKLTSPDLKNSKGVVSRQLSLGNSRKEGSPISSPGIKRPSQIFRQQLLEQSISMSLAGLGLNNLTEVKPAQDVLKDINITPANDCNLHPRKLSRVNSKRKKSPPVLSPIVKRESQIFRQRLLEQSVSMLLDGSSLKNSTSIKPTQDITKSVVIQTLVNNRNLYTRQLSRVNSRRKRTSISSPSVKRASQIFRQRLLEQSISMSLTDSGSNSLPQSKLPTRRLSRRAKDRKAIKERKSGVDKIKPKKSNSEHSPKAVNVLPMSKILESEELYLKVNQEIQRQARLKPPQPPPRKTTHDSLAPSFIPTLPRPKKNSSPLISSLPEMRTHRSLTPRSVTPRSITPRSITPRSVTPTSPRPISIDPFPTHLSRRSIMKFPLSMPLHVASMF